jgi:hypothetical protein
VEVVLSRAAVVMAVETALALTVAVVGEVGMAEVV